MIHWNNWATLFYNSIPKHFEPKHSMYTHIQSESLLCMLRISAYVMWFRFALYAIVTVFIHKTNSINHITETVYVLLNVIMIIDHNNH